jgi:leucine dehydrogenase
MIDAYASARVNSGMVAAETLSIPGYDAVYRVPCAGTVAFVALHSLIRGRTFGGIRIRPYPDERAALDDALGLARAMTRKVVLTGIEGGGGKSVLMEPRADREQAVAALGEFIESLAGRYFSGPDLGFTAADGDALARTTRYVACGGLSQHTAESVLAAMCALGEPETVAVQGLGAVGLPLAERLRERGVRVIASDPRGTGAFASVADGAIYETPCDVFAPCAIGGVIDARTLPRLRCRTVCGGANNPLASDAMAGELVRRDIVYVPDFIANAGAAIHGASRAIGEQDRIPERMARVATLVREVTERARRERRSPHHVAIELADARAAELKTRSGDV